jgi:hypothetical protein
MPPALSISSRESSASRSSERYQKLNKTLKSNVMVVIDKATAFAYSDDVGAVLALSASSKGIQRFIRPIWQTISKPLAPIR